MKTSSLTDAESVIRTHTTELDITCAGQTKTHELRVMYTYEPAMPARHRNISVPLAELAIDPPVPAQVEIHDIKVIVDFGGGETKTEYQIPMECKCLSPEHIEAIEREILDSHES